MNKKNKKISYKQQLLTAFQNNVNEWTCTHCNSDSAQPARITADLRAEGYDFEMCGNCYVKRMYCPHCGVIRPHGKLLSLNPVNNSKNRFPMTDTQRERVLSIIGKKDAYTGASITSSTPEVDHKEPMSRLTKDIDIDKLTDEEIPNHFQTLTKQNNLLKAKACDKCKLCGIRPDHFGVKYWYEGDEVYRGTCVGCGWYDGVAWRAHLNEHLKK